MELDDGGAGQGEAEIIWDDEPAGGRRGAPASPRVAPEDLAAAEIDAARRNGIVTPARAAEPRAGAETRDPAGPEPRPDPSPRTRSAPRPRTAREPGAARPARAAVRAGSTAPQPRSRSGRRPRRGPRVGLIFVLLALLIVGAVGWRIWRNRREQDSAGHRAGPGRGHPGAGRRRVRSRLSAPLRRQVRPSTPWGAPSRMPTRSARPPTRPRSSSTSAPRRSRTCSPRPADRPRRLGVEVRDALQGPILHLRHVRRGHARRTGAPGLTRSRTWSCPRARPAGSATAGWRGPTGSPAIDLAGFELFETAGPARSHTSRSAPGSGRSPTTTSRSTGWSGSSPRAACSSRTTGRSRPSAGRPPRRSSYRRRTSHEPSAAGPSRRLLSLAGAGRSRATGQQPGRRSGSSRRSLERRPDLVGREVVVDDRVAYYVPRNGSEDDELQLKRTPVTFRVPRRLRPAAHARIDGGGGPGRPGARRQPAGLPGHEPGAQAGRPGAAQGRGWTELWPAGLRRRGRPGRGGPSAARRSSRTTP